MTEANPDVVDEIVVVDSVNKPQEIRLGQDTSSKTQIQTIEAELATIDRPKERIGHLDLTRAWLAYALLGLFAFEIIVALAVAALTPSSSTAILQILDKVITPTVGLVGAVSAFYYARERG